MNKISIAVLWTVGLADRAFAQGCAMCQTVGSSKAIGTDGFNASIVFLAMIPYVLIAAVGGWVWLCRRRRSGVPES
ncbi:MAG: hypothetical protein FJY97_10540 [candidate division Zixibacteria bacterium]|nr:hypothetical protein [candidate division Zixibacteria bacterium]